MKKVFKIIIMLAILALSFMTVTVYAAELNSFNVEVNSRSVAPRRKCHYKYSIWTRNGKLYFGSGV